VFRFLKIYGISKTLFKIAGRARTPFLLKILKSQKKNPNVAVIGCGQFTFSTVGHVLTSRYGNIFVDCYDIDCQSRDTFADFYDIPVPSHTSDDIFNNKNVKYVYIASNHASHVDYAVSALLKGKVVYLEKPIAVTKQQLCRLLRCIEQTKGVVYAGYNRPFSQAVKDLYVSTLGNGNIPITLNCFVSGHKIPEDHWYRSPGEGTRICGNVGHWIDLAIHMLSWGECPDKWDIQISYSSDFVRDDDISISLTSSRGDLIVIILTSRSEPFEGINETINFQQGSVICKIDDFRSSTIWRGHKIFKSKYWPKDVGHKNALYQPFEKEKNRKWNEVVKSTLLMLHISEMVKNSARNSIFSFEESMSSITE
jgi:predicted dehydrogenase